MTSSLNLLHNYGHEHWIRRINEPQRLVLAWQAPDHLGDRYRWAVGDLRREAALEYAFRYLEDDAEFTRLNPGRTHEAIFKLGYNGYPAFRLGAGAFGEAAISPFLRRIPPYSRRDFRKYLESFCIWPDVFPSQFALLGLTEAKLPGDGFSLVDAYEDPIPERELLLELAGHRYYRPRIAISYSDIGSAVDVLPEPDNEHDPQAVVVKLRGDCIGYINRLQAPTFLRWIGGGRVRAELARLNGDEQKPRAFIFVWVMPE